MDNALLLFTAWGFVVGFVGGLVAYHVALRPRRPRLDFERPPYPRPRVLPWRENN